MSSSFIDSLVISSKELLPSRRVVSSVTLNTTNTVKIDKRDIRPVDDSLRDTRYRSSVTSSMCIQRNELIKELTVLYGASKPVLLLGSISMLLRWRSCYRAVYLKRFLSSCKQDADII